MMHRPLVAFSAALSLVAGLAVPVFAGEGLRGGLSGSAVALGGQPGSAQAAVAVDFLQHPCLSPDGKTVVFSWAGDLWAGPATGGAAARITSHPGEDRRPQFSPDGTKLAFESDRDGGRNLFIGDVTRTADGTMLLGQLRRLTFVDRPLTLSGFSSDGKRLLFFANLDATAFRGTRMYSVSVAGGPIERISEAFGSSPHMTPDGSSILFHRDRLEYNRPRYVGTGASDLFRMNIKDGSFTKLTTDAHSDGDGFGLPDGRVLFVSGRSGTNNLWLLPAGATGDGQAIQLTRFDPKSDDPTGVTIGHGVRDVSVAASGASATFVVWDTLYTLDLKAAGAKPVAVRFTATLDEQLQRTQRRDLSKEVSEQAISPDGKSIAVAARGEIFVRSTEEGLPTRRITTGTGRARDIVWSPDNRVLYFCNDEAGSSAIYYAKVAMAKEDLAEKPAAKDGKDEKAADGKGEPEKAAEPASATKPKEGTSVGDDDETAPARRRRNAPAAGGGTGGTAGTGNASAEEPTKPGTEKGEADKKADGDKEPAKKKGPDYGKRWAEALRFTVTKLDTGKLAAGKNDGLLGAELRSPTPSPDGTKLIFTRGLGDVVLMDLRSKECRVLMEGWHEPSVQWTADSRHIVYVQEDEDFNSDIFIADTQPGADGVLPVPENITRHPDNDDQPALSADGKVLYFRSERARGNDETQVFMVFLDKKLEGLRPYELEDYFKKAGEAAKKAKKVIDPVLWDETEKKEEAEKKEESGKPAAVDATKGEEPGKAEPKKDEKKTDPADEPKDEKKDDKKDDKKAEEKKPAKKPEPKPLKFDTDDAYLRIRRISSVPGSVGSVLTSPGGERVIFSTGGEGEPQVLSLSYKGDDRKVVLTGPASGITLSPAGDKVGFVRAGVASSTPLAGGKVDSYPIDAPVLIDVPSLQRQKFREVARIMGNGFYHPTLKGLNWPAITERYLKLAEKTRTSDEFDRVANQLMGELDGSHTGVISPAGFSAGAIGTGYLGIEGAPVETGYKVQKVLPQGPADREVSKLKVGDIITAVEGQSLVGVDFYAAMAQRSGKETLLDVIRADGGKSATVLITPIGSAEDTDLRYRATTLERRDLVTKLSGGKLGYLHIRGMSEAYVRDFERDLFAAGNGKLGLVIDVRDNGGGSTADILLSSLTAPNHAYTANRGVDPTKVKKDAYPRDRRLIYGYTRPISLVINENSFSNAEIFAHAIKTIGRGKLVGTATYGGVISTGQATLVDGTTVRTPFRGWYLPDGSDFENNGAKPDINVPQNPSDEAAGRDPQLEAAVAELLARASK